MYIYIHIYMYIYIHTYSTLRRTTNSTSSPGASDHLAAPMRPPPHAGTQSPNIATKSNLSGYQTPVTHEPTLSLVTSPRPSPLSPAPRPPACSSPAALAPSGAGALLLGRVLTSTNNVSK
jgi:hypothetical protein